jgi:rod shape-determining protein MreC
VALASNETAPLFSPGTSSTLRLIAYLAATIVLMVADHRNEYLTRIRWGLSTAIEPMYRIAAWPSEMARKASQAVTDHDDLTRQIQVLTEQHLLDQARLNRMGVLRDENQRLQELLDAQRSLGLGVQLAKIIDVDTDPARHRIIINAGARQHVQIGQAVLDAHGVMGQVVEVLPNTSTVLLITDASHALPVTIERTGMRVIAHGSGALDKLELPNVPISADVKIGDRLITSGLGGHFPAGFPVGEIRSISNDASGMFAAADAKPSAALDRSGDVLILQPLPDQIGPPALAPAEGPPTSLAPTAEASKP